jgi:large subunit ribosomal protein L17
MKHLKKIRKFSREKKQREAMIKIMVGNLFSRGKINTTLAKAKELKTVSERIVSQIKKATNLRPLMAKLPKNIDRKILQNIKEKTASRNSGFFRVTKKGFRRSDSAKLASIEFVDNLNETEVKKDAKK